MLKLLGFLIKATLFSAVVLIAGNLIHVGDRTVSEHVNSMVTSVTNAGIPGKLQEWANSQPAIPTDRVDHARRAPSRNLSASAKSESNSGGDEITPTERKKLKALIEEMNR